MNVKDQVLPVWTQMLGTLDGLLTKAQSHERGDALLQAKLADDMHPLAVQVRFLCNMPGEGMARLSNLDFTSSDDDPTSLADARKRIADTLKLLASWSDRSFVAEEAPIELSLPNGMIFDMTAGEYIRDWALAQYYFHTTTAYAILRAEGLEIGKIDFVPYMMRYMRQSKTA